MPPSNSIQQELLQRFIRDVVCQIRCHPEGYDRVRDLAVDFMADCGEDPEKLARDFGFRTFTDFLHASIMRTEIEIRNDPSGYVYVARPDPLVSHIHAEQMRSRHARDKRQEKERYYEQNAGTIGRRTYSDDGGGYNPPSDGFSVGLPSRASSRQQQPDPNDNYYSPNGVRHENSQYADKFDNCYDNRPGGGSDYGDKRSNSYREDRRYYDEEPPRGDHDDNQQTENFRGPNSDDYRHQSSDSGRDNRNQSSGSGVKDYRSHLYRNEYRGHQQQFYDDNCYDGEPLSNDRTSASRGNFAVAAPAPLGFDTGLQTSSRDDRSDLRDSSVVQVEWPAPQRDTPPSQKAPEDPVSAKNVALPPLAASALERHREFSKTPPAGVAAIGDIVWEEDDDDGETNGQVPASTGFRTNAGFFGAVSSAVAAADRKPERHRKAISDSDDEGPPRQTAIFAVQKKQDVTPPSKPVTRWTSRAKDGEFTDTDEDEDDEKVDKITTTDSAKAAPFQNVTTFTETKGTLKPRVPSSVSSSSDTSTLHNNQSAAKNLSPLKKDNSESAAAVFNLPARPESTTATTLEGRRPASHGEKWLIEMKRQQLEKNLDSVTSTSVLPPATKSNSAERAAAASTTIFRPVSRNLTAVTAVEPPAALHRPTVVKPDKAADKISDWVNDKSPSKSATTINIAAAVGGSTDGRPLHRTGSMTSVFSAATSRRWSRVLTDDDLKRMSLVVNSVVQYYFPRTVLLDDLIVVVEMVEPRFASLEQAFGGEFLEYLERFCQRVEVIGRAGHYNLLWREDEKATK